MYCHPYCVVGCKIKMAAAERSDEGTSLKDVFEQGFLLHSQIEDDDEPSTSEAFQVIFSLVT